MSPTSSGARLSGASQAGPSVDLHEEGPAAPPRSNGELVFEEPWEGRVFGVTMALVETGAVSLSEFQSELVAEIQGWEAAHAEDVADGRYRYYERWLVAFERILDRKGLCSGATFEAKALELAQRPDGHDHR